MSSSPPPPPAPDAPLSTAPLTPPPPRAFAQGAGVVMQTVGAILFFSSCCICLSTGAWEPLAPREQVLSELAHGERPGVSLRTLIDRPAAAGYMLTAVTATVGGLSICVLGLGLQADRRRAALAQLLVTVFVTLILFLGATALWLGGAPLMVRLWNHVLVMVMTLLTIMAFAAYREVVAAPPPADIDIIPPGTKIPYSFYHQDPPEVRLARELESRRAKLQAEQVEIDRIQKDLDSRTGDTDRKR